MSWQSKSQVVMNLEQQLDFELQLARCCVYTRSSVIEILSTRNEMLTLAIFLTVFYVL
jgi:hypothetical protein